MFDKPDLMLHGLCTVDDHPVACEYCDSTTALEISKRGFRETWPAYLTCLSCGKGADHDLITNGLVDAAKAAATGRARAEDRDTFRAEWRGIVFAGEQAPEFCLDDALQAGKAVASELRAQAKEQKKQVTGRARTWWGGQKKTTRAAVAEKVGGAKAAALGAAWQIQTGGAGPTQKPRTRRCPVKGCRKGTVTLTTRVHGTKPGRATKERVPCGFCHRNAAS